MLPCCGFSFTSCELGLMTDGGHRDLKVYMWLKLTKTLLCPGVYGVKSFHFLCSLHTLHFIKQKFSPAF